MSIRNRAAANAEVPARDVFTVALAGTVSAGKTTVLNALLGRELLYSSNEPATASQPAAPRQAAAAQTTAPAGNGLARSLFRQLSRWIGQSRNDTPT